MAAPIPAHPPGWPPSQPPYADLACTQATKAVQRTELIGSARSLRGLHSRLLVGAGLAFHQQRSRTRIPDDENPPEDLRLLSDSRGRTSPRPHSKLYLYGPQTRSPRA